MLKKVSRQSFPKLELKGLILIIVGSLTWSLTMVKSGLVHDYGMGFWGANGHDGVWHIALANSLARGSFEMPTFAGVGLQNYHLGFDLLLAFLHKVTTIPTQTLYFQIIPPTFAVLVGLLTYRFVFNWTKVERSALWSLFFVYFGGSLGWLLGKGESTFWSQQAVSSLINPPFTLSLIFLLVGLIFLQNKKYFLAAFAFGLLIQIKAYAGVLAVGGLLVAGVWQLIKKKELKLIKVFIGSLALSLALFLPFNQPAGGLFVFQPFWFLETMMQFSDRVGWQRFGEAMINYRLGYVWFKAIPAYLLAFIIFWYGNMGTRFLGEIYIGKKLVDWKKLGSLEVFVLSIVFAGALIPMFFLQGGTPWNTIQFFYYALFFSGILAGITLSRLDSTGTKSRLIIAAVVLLTLPTTMNTLKDHYLPSRPPAKLSPAELEALEFLKLQDSGIVLTYPFDKAAADEAVANPPRPLYLYESTAYVAAFANKTIFLEDEVNLNITGYKWRDRREKVEEFFKSKDRNFLRENDIGYIYLVKNQNSIDEGNLGVRRIFENEEVDIFRIKN